ncbi:hypothetical protein INT43_006441 [Umbelopsis isabellina]|uniref:Uncharacterized protein n=1 Tax=Mortierella isabellina TaxID=91625 RepID=A0A8H7Q170_MORIS|nr:hypothetical protein INT43_006441 [Umbelopsis isabellina]
MVRDRIHGWLSCCFGSLFGFLFIVVFAGGWIGTTVWGLYTTTEYIHEIQSVAATNCTILDATMDDDDDGSYWLIHASYMIPVQLGVPANTTKISILDGTDYNAHYSVNQTLSCWVSTINFNTVTLSPSHVDAGTIIGLIILILMAIPLFIGVLYVVFYGFGLVCTFLTSCFASLKRERRHSFETVVATESLQIDEGGYNLNNRSLV